MPVWITSRFGVLSDKNGGFRRADAGMSGDFISGFRRIGKDFTVIFSLTAFGRSLNLSDNRVNQVLSDKP